MGGAVVGIEVVGESDGLEVVGSGLPWERDGACTVEASEVYFGVGVNIRDKNRVQVESGSERTGNFNRAKI